ncbi:Pentatricopeptide repeat-containing protein [Nymphaea thermarum]|nr:Pentatricopeptide repeat-containing protein [Nymphaea thermarum]
MTVQHFSSLQHGHRCLQACAQVSRKPAHVFPRKSCVLQGFRLCCHTRTQFSERGVSKARKKKYGGCIPSVLRSLEVDSDVSNALRPWVGKLSPKEQTVVLKEQRDWNTALLVFRWFKSQEDYVANVIHYNIVLRILGRAQKWDQLRLCWIEMAADEVLPTNNTYATLIDVYAKGGLPKEALEWLRHMKIREIFPDEVTMNTAVHVLKEAGEFDQAERFFKNWCVGKMDLDQLNICTADAEMGPKYFLSTELFKAGRPRLSNHFNGRNSNKVSNLSDSSTDHMVAIRKPKLAATYNTLIDLYGKAGRLKDASNAFAEMLRSGVVPDKVTFNTMIYTCGSHGNMNEAEALLCKMEERGVSPDTTTLNTFIGLYATAGDMDNMLKFYRKINGMGLLPNVVTYRTILQAFGQRKMVAELELMLEEMEQSGISIDEQSVPVIIQMYIDLGQLDRAQEFLEGYQRVRGLSSVNHAAVLDAYAEKGLWKEAEAVFLDRRESEKKMETMECNVMIKAYGIANMHDQALSMFQSMRSHGAWPDECTYNSLIQMLSDGESADVAGDFLTRMQESGFRPSRETFCAVIARYARDSRAAEAVDVYRQMIRAGVDPNEIVYGSLINAFAEAGNVEDALHYFHVMEESGLKTNQVVYTSLIKAYSKIGSWREAQELYEKMLNLDDGPDIIASNSMIRLYSELGMVHEAKSIFDKLRAEGSVDGVSFTTMMHLYKNMGMVDVAVEVAQELRQSDLLADSASYNAVMSIFSTSGQLKECAEVLHQMLVKKISPNNTTFKAIFTALKKSCLPIEATSQLGMLYKDRKPYSKQAIITLLFSAVGMHSHAQKYCEGIMIAEAKLDVRAYNVLIYAFVASGEVDKALNFFMKMQDEGLEADTMTYINLVTCYGRAGLIEGVKRIHRQMKSGEIGQSASLLNALVDAYRNLGKRDLADLVNQERWFDSYTQPEDETNVEIGSPS